MSDEASVKDKSIFLGYVEVVDRECELQFPAIKLASAPKMPLPATSHEIIFPP